MKMNKYIKKLWLVTNLLLKLKFKIQEKKNGLKIRLLNVLKVYMQIKNKKYQLNN